MDLLGEVAMWFLRLVVVASLLIGGATYIGRRLDGGGIGNPDIGGAKTRLGRTQCTTCFEWSRSGRFDPAGITLDDTLPFGVAVEERICPKCGGSVRFPQSGLDEGSAPVVLLKRLAGIRCPECWKLDWRTEYDATVLSDARIGGAWSNRYEKTIQRRHKSCGYTWQTARTYWSGSG